MRRALILALLVPAALLGGLLFFTRSRARPLPADSRQEGTGAPPATADPLEALAAGEDALSAPRAAAPEAGAALELRVRDDLGQPVTGVLFALHLRPSPATGLDELVLPFLRANVDRRGLPAHGPGPREPHFHPRLDGRTSDAGGLCSWSALPAGAEFGLFAFTDALVAELPLRPAGFERWARARWLTLADGERRTLEFVLPRTCTLRGRILDAARRPPRGARVEVRSSAPEAEAPGPRSQTTDADGRFVVRDLPAGAGSVGASFTSDSGAEVLVTASWSAAPGAEVDLGELVPWPRRVALSLLALDPSGEDVSTQARRDDEPRLVRLAVRVPPSWTLLPACALGGRVELHGLPLLAARIELDPEDLRLAPGFRLAGTPGRLTYELPPGVDELPLAVPVLRGRRVRCVAPPVRRDGVGEQMDVAALRVLLVPEEGPACVFEMSALLGLEFESLQSLPAGTYTLFAATADPRDDLCAQETVTLLDEEDQRLELHLGPGARCAGRALDDTGAPLTRGAIEFTPLDPQGVRELPWLQRDWIRPDGTFAAGTLPPDRVYRIQPGGKVFTARAGEHALELVVPRAAAR